MSQVLVSFLTLLGAVYSLLILARVVLSWMSPMGGGAFTAFIYQVTEPVLAPIRRVLPPMGGLDWSPFIALLLLSLLLRVVARL
jgi:YggT family protein